MMKRGVREAGRLGRMLLRPKEHSGTPTGAEQGEEEEDGTEIAA